MGNSNAPATTPAPTPTPAPKPDSDLNKAATLADKEPKPAVAREYPKVARVVSKVGPMMHLHQNVMINERPVKIDIDGFAKAQLDAGKWALDAE